MKFEKFYVLSDWWLVWIGVTFLALKFRLIRPTQIG